MCNVNNKMNYCNFCSLVDNDEKLIIVKNKIYDVSEVTHPPGNHIILRAIKTKQNQEHHIKFHSKETQKSLKKYYKYKLTFCQCDLCTEFKKSK